MLKLLLTFFVLLHLSRSDVLTRNGMKIQLKLETSNNNFLELGKLSIYSNFPFGNEPIKITCSKLNCQEDGLLEARVNGAVANKYGACLSYFPTSIDEFKCLSQAFQFTLINDPNIALYEIECRFKETANLDAVKIDLIRLNNDAAPRIRSGSVLDPTGLAKTHNLTKEEVSCEAVRDLMSGRVEFDDINWYSDKQKLELFSKQITINNRYTNYTIKFEPLFVLNKTFSCCTSLNGTVVKCESSYLTKS